MSDLIVQSSGKSVTAQETARDGNHRKQSDASVSLDLRRTVGKVDRRIFSGFAEHIGRVVYGGIYDPGSTLSDNAGFRKDVLELLKPLRMPAVRYPGGNFVSNYDWRDGIGPRDQRRVRPDFAWKTLESNQFGVDEFLAWCKALGSDPMMVVNLGTGDARDGAELLEYCNLPQGSYWSDQRAANGHPEPYNIRLWGLGNEMDGAWQAGHCPAEIYAQRAYGSAQLMKGLDPSIEVVLCGSTIPAMPTYMGWDQAVLEECWELVDYISAHHYSKNHSRDTRLFLAEGQVIDDMIEDYRALIRFVQAKKKSRKPIYVAFDEWNVWYRDEKSAEQWWSEAPPLLEEQYNLEDALVVAQYLSSFIRHADVVKIACIAQVVNVIAPVLTRPDGVLAQTIYYPFLMYSQAAGDVSLSCQVRCRTYKAGDRENIPVLDVAATTTEAGDRASLFLINRDTEQAVTSDIEFSGGKIKRIISVSEVSGDDPHAVNTWEAPNTIVPREGKAYATRDRLVVESPALSFVVVQVELET